MLVWSEVQLYRKTIRPRLCWRLWIKVPFIKLCQYYIWNCPFCEICLIAYTFLWVYNEYLMIPWRYLKVDDSLYQYYFGHFPLPQEKYGFIGPSCLRTKWYTLVNINHISNKNSHMIFITKLLFCYELIICFNKIFSTLTWLQFWI
jgi:hypothetical protein